MKSCEGRNKRGVQWNHGVTVLQNLQLMTNITKSIFDNSKIINQSSFKKINSGILKFIFNLEKAMLFKNVYGCYLLICFHHSGYKLSQCQ